MEFSQILQELMNLKGVTSYRLGKEIDVRTSTVTSWLNGRNPQLAHLIKVADYFDVSLDYLRGKTDVKKDLAANDDKVETILSEIVKQLSPESKRVVMERALTLKELESKQGQ